MSRVSSKIPSVATASVGGVHITRHILELEAASMAWSLHRLGLRIKQWFRQTRTKTGEPVIFPDQAQLMCIAEYNKGVLGLLKEQRERAKMGPKNGGPAISDEDFEKGLAELVAHAVRTMPETQLRELLADRARMGAPLDVEVK